MIKFELNLIAEWPPLAWAAQCSPHNSVITVYHGSRVEVCNEWFCEAVWDNEYTEGNFDLTDLVFGSGCRIRDEKVTFVSSGTTVDRLQTLTRHNNTWVSNSLVCLMAITDANLDLTYSHYIDEIGSITDGLSNYKRELKTTDASIKLTYFNNLQWDGQNLVEVEKPKKVHDFSTFSKYENFLSSSLYRISTNMSSQERKYPYQMLGTLSSGYDSTTNTVLAQKTGLNEVISCTSARRGGSDDGKEIANFLGVKLALIPRDKWQSGNFPEVPFITGDAKGGDVFYSAASDNLPGRVLLTGYHGDKVWAKETSTLDSTIVRGDRSGLSLTEYRLWIGFIHLPLPFMGVRQIKDINSISNAAEMEPWDIPGKYSRPICRRIVEGAGVSRNQFGISKKAASVLFGSSGDALSDVTRHALYEWTRLHSTAWSSKGKVPPYKIVNLIKRLNRPLRLVKQGLRLITRISPSPFKSRIKGLTKRLENIEVDLLLLKHAFPWAVEKAKDRYKAFHTISIKSEVEF